jgi:hypothetical protein
MWAVGQAEAVKRSLELFSQPGKASDGLFPEFTFFDCHSCHRRIYDSDEATVTAMPNPGRPIHAGMPPYNDENMIMLLAAARVIAPDLATTFDARSKAFHRAMGEGRAQTVQAAQALRQAADTLSTRFAGATFTREQTFAVMDAIASDAVSERFTDYEGAVQSVMAIDTLLNGLVNQGAVSGGPPTACACRSTRPMRRCGIPTASSRSLSAARWAGPFAASGACADAGVCTDEGKLALRQSAASGVIANRAVATLASFSLALAGCGEAAVLRPRLRPRRHPPAARASMPRPGRKR